MCSQTLPGGNGFFEKGKSQMSLEVENTENEMSFDSCVGPIWIPVGPDGVVEVHRQHLENWLHAAYMKGVYDHANQVGTGSGV